MCDEMHRNELSKLMKQLGFTDRAADIPDTEMSRIDELDSFYSEYPQLRESNVIMQSPTLMEVV